MSLLVGRTVSFLTTASMEVPPNHGQTVTGGAKPWRSFMTTGRTGWPPGTGKMLVYKLITSECINSSEKTVNIIVITWYLVIDPNFRDLLTLTSFIWRWRQCVFGTYAHANVNWLSILPRGCPCRNFHLFTMNGVIDHLSKCLREWTGFTNLNFRGCNFPGYPLLVTK